jgi:hypothetical protein
LGPLDADHDGSTIVGHFVTVGMELKVKNLINCRTQLHLDCLYNRRFLLSRDGFYPARRILHGNILDARGRVSAAKGSQNAKWRGVS